MNRSARRLPAAVAITSLSIVPLASTATATSPPESDGDGATFIRTEQTRVDAAAEAFAGVMREAGLSAEDETESNISNRRVRREYVVPDLDVGPANECFDSSVVAAMPPASDIDLRAYAVAWSVDFLSDGEVIEWTAFGLAGPTGDPVYDLRVRAHVPESDDCLEEAITSALESSDWTDDSAISDAAIDVTSHGDLGVGDTSSMVSIAFSGSMDGEDSRGTLLSVNSAVAEGYVSVSAESESAGSEPDEGLAREALTAMVAALES